MKKLWLGLGAVFLLIAIGAYIWLQPAPQPPAPTAPVAAPTRIAPPSPEPPPEAAIKYPVEAPPGMSTTPPEERAEDFLKRRVTELLGANNVTLHVQIEDFVRRVAATVDNLGRPFAPPRVWPVHPTPGRFTIEGVGEARVISATNAARYAPFVALVESVDSARAVALYRQLYPLFQRAYESLGYPGRYFNDRLVAVIDQLLATPEPQGPLKVELPEIQGPLQPAHPWLLYRFADPALEGLASGQKILLRVGPENERRLKAKLGEIRKLIAADKAPR
jgi:hypothetical protein